MFYYFYKITNNINGKYYYGVHSTTDMNDGYMGSGKIINKAYNKYGKSNFTKTVLRYFVGNEDMFAYERQIVTNDLVKDPMCYNVAIGGCGGNIIAGYSDDVKQDIYNKISKSKKGKKLSSEARDNIRQGVLKFCQIPEYRKKMSDAAKKSLSRPEVRQKLSMKAKGRKVSDETRKKIGDHNRGKVRSDEEKIRISNKLKGRHLSDEHKKNLSNVTLNRIWITNGVERKRIHESELNIFLYNGWSKGRKIKTQL